MPNEELIQRGYLDDAGLKGDVYGSFEHLSLGATNVRELRSIGLVETIPNAVDFPFSIYKPPKNPANTKPDDVYFDRNSDVPQIIAVKEMKKPSEFDTEQKRTSAAEQALYSSATVGANVGITSDGSKYLYINVQRSLNNKTLVFFEEEDVSLARMVMNIQVPYQFTRAQKIQIVPSVRYQKSGPENKAFLSRKSL